MKVSSIPSITHMTIVLLFQAPLDHVQNPISDITFVMGMSELYLLEGGPLSVDPELEDKLLIGDFLGGLAGKWIPNRPGLNLLVELPHSILDIETCFEFELGTSEHFVQYARDAVNGHMLDRVEPAMVSHS